MYKKSVMQVQSCCFASKTYCFFTFSSPSASLDLKVPIIKFLETPVRQFALPLPLLNSSHLPYPTEVLLLNNTSQRNEKCIKEGRDAFYWGLYPSSMEGSLTKIRFALFRDPDGTSFNDLGFAVQFLKTSS